MQYVGKWQKELTAAFSFWTLLLRSNILCCNKMLLPFDLSLSVSLIDWLACCRTSGTCYLFLLKPNDLIFHPLLCIFLLNTIKSLILLNFKSSIYTAVTNKPQVNDLYLDPSDLQVFRLGVAMLWCQNISTLWIKLFFFFPIKQKSNPFIPLIN